MSSAIMITGGAEELWECAVSGEVVDGLTDGVASRPDAGRGWRRCWRGSVAEIVESVTWPARTRSTPRNATACAGSSKKLKPTATACCPAHTPADVPRSSTARSGPSGGAGDRGSRRASWRPVSVVGVRWSRRARVRRC